METDMCGRGLKVTMWRENVIAFVILPVNRPLNKQRACSQAIVIVLQVCQVWARMYRRKQVIKC